MKKKFRSAKQLEELLTEFLLQCERSSIHPTVAGAAYYVGTNRKALIAYKNSNNTQYREVIERFLTAVEAKTEVAMLQGHINVRAAIFSLKNNFDWKESTEPQPQPQPVITYDFSKFSTEELTKIIEKDEK